MKKFLELEESTMVRIGSSRISDVVAAALEKSEPRLTAVEADASTHYYMITPSAERCLPANYLKRVSMNSIVSDLRISC